MKKRIRSIWFSLVLILYILTVSLGMATQSFAYTIEGTLFHDYNGNGTRDTAYALGDPVIELKGQLSAKGPIEEPIIAGAEINFGGYQTTSNAEEKYIISLPADTYNVLIKKEIFRFYFESIRFMKELSEGIPTIISADMTKNFGLGIGCMTFPFDKSHPDPSKPCNQYR